MINTKSQYKETTYKAKYEILKWRLRGLAFLARHLEYPADAWKIISESIELVNAWERKEKELK